jgi:CHAT domain-containing protein
MVTMIFASIPRLWTPLRVAILLLAHGGVIWLAGADQLKSDPGPSEREKLEKEARGLAAEGQKLHQQGKFPEAVERTGRALAMRQQLYPEGMYPDGHPDLATSLDRLGTLQQAMGEYGQALVYMERALAMRQKLYPEAQYPQGHLHLASSLNNLGLLLYHTGEYRRARPYLERTLAMLTKLYPEEKHPGGNPHLAGNLNNLGALLQATGEYGRALAHYERGLAMCQQLYPETKYPDGHPNLAKNLGNLGSLLIAMGEDGKAVFYHKRALAMFQKLYPEAKYPQGHPDLAVSLSNLGSLVEVMGEHGKALAYQQRALAMLERLYPEAKYPQGHPDLATGLSNLGSQLMVMGEYDTALPYRKRALAMLERLYPEAKYPRGHPHLAAGISNLSSLLQATGQYGRALAHHDRALAMCQKLYPEIQYPEGHPLLTRNLSDRGFILQHKGESDKALPYLERALATARKYAAREIAAAPEAQALAHLHSLLPTRDHYLSAAVQRGQPGVTSYQQVWDDKAALMRLQQRRHGAVLIARGKSDKAHEKYEQLTDARQHVNRLLVDPGKDLKYRDKRLAELTDKQENLERELSALLPEIARQKALAKLGPGDLINQLPTAAVFVDFVQYVHCHKGQPPGPRYLAFVVAPGRPLRCVELGDAGPINQAIDSWRRGIDRREASGAPAKLRELVWDKIDQGLPPSTRTIYLAPDGDLARLPFAALSGKQSGTVLLEDYLLALVPHGPWLLEQLLYPPHFRDGTGHLVAVGGVRYDPTGAVVGTPYAELPASSQELRQVQAMFLGSKPSALSGAEATTAAVQKHLPHARYAHLATHGYFDEKGLSEERRRIREQMKASDLHLGGGMERVGLGARNPLGYVGLALAGANDPAKAGPDGGILTGLGVVDLPLEGLRLCVLSACETGLGELTEGEGVVGLQRAFHVAGCPNVIGSLWKVNDAATAALMTQFYHELWVNKRPPLEALREAQLTIYRHPERIPALAGERGAPDLTKAAKLGSARAEPQRPQESRQRADTKRWAAFVLSGSGR